MKLFAHLVLTLIGGSLLANEHPADQAREVLEKATVDIERAEKEFLASVQLIEDDEKKKQVLGYFKKRKDAWATAMEADASLKVAASPAPDTNTSVGLIPLCSDARHLTDQAKLLREQAKWIKENWMPEAEEMIAPLADARPKIEPTSEIITSDLGIDKYVVVPSNEDVEALLVTLKVTKGNEVVAHSSHAQFNNPISPLAKRSISLLMIKPYMVGGDYNGLIVRVSTGESHGGVLKLPGWMGGVSQPHSPEPNVLVMDFPDEDVSGYRIQFMVEEVTLIEAEKVCGKKAQIGEESWVKSTPFTPARAVPEMKRDPQTKDSNANPNR